MPDQDPSNLSPLARAYSAMGYTGPMPVTPRHSLIAGVAAVATRVEPADPPPLDPERLAQIEELLEIDPDETVNRLKSAWDPNLTEDQLRTVLAGARALIDRPHRFLPMLEATATLSFQGSAVPPGFTFPGMDLDEISINPDDHKFEEIGDALGWVLFAAFPALFPPTKADFRKAEDFQSRFEYRLPEPSSQNPLDIAVFADFGTGRYHSHYIAKQFRTRAVPFALHLGDVYYAGRQSEFEEFFEAPLDPILDNTELFMLNSNHEMFSGSKWYFDFMDRKRQGRTNQRQEGSYFSLTNSKFQIVGVDTAYHKTGRFPKEDLQNWLRAKLTEGRAANRINILLTADHPYEYGKNAFTQLFTKDLFDLSTNGLIDLWFWGNTHYCGLFERSVTARFIGSCVGHGGFPYTKKKKGEFSVVPVRFVETRARFPESTRLRQDMGNNGYCLMSLHDSGAITLRYFDWMSTLRCTAELERPDMGGPLVIRSAIEHAE